MTEPGFRSISASLVAPTGRRRRSCSHTGAMFEVAKEVVEAHAAGLGVVALESTIITHGMTYPTNAETALEVEQVVRDAGAVPATIAVLDGVIRVGLDAEAIDQLGAVGTAAAKVSRRDLASVIHRGETGGTTVAATMIAAQRADISVFATGGIGGVHRGGEHTLDISADLQELARTDVTVVCAGIKSILDLGRTREYLETLGVPVLGFGTDTLPAFYTRESDHGIDHRVDDPREVAALIRIRRELALGGGMIVANPIPEAASLDRTTIDEAIERANADADAAGIIGKDITPFLLERVGELTGESSVRANVALVKNNAHVAARIAVELSELDGTDQRAR